MCGGHKAGPDLHRPATALAGAVRQETLHLRLQRRTFPKHSLTRSGRQQAVFDRKPVYEAHQLTFEFKSGASPAFPPGTFQESSQVKFYISLCLVLPWEFREILIAYLFQILGECHCAYNLFAALSPWHLKSAETTWRAYQK